MESGAPDQHIDLTLVLGATLTAARDNARLAEGDDGIGDELHVFSGECGQIIVEDQRSLATKGVVTRQGFLEFLVLDLRFQSLFDRLGELSVKICSLDKYSTEQDSVLVAN